MTDVFTKSQRSRVMSRIKGRNTKPEIFVRSLIHRMGFRFRLHRRDLPGTPDIVLPRHHKIIFVHGCFWHGHRNCKRATRPTTNVEFWNKKIDKNIERDDHVMDDLQKGGWKVLVVWQCEIINSDELQRKLERFLQDDSKYDVS